MSISTMKQELEGKNRFFIPMVPPYIKQELLKTVLLHTNWIGFNYFEIRNSRLYPLFKARGIRGTLGIDDKTKIFLSSTAKDRQLTNFYDKSSGIEKFKSDTRSFGIDLLMGPDWFSYKNDPFAVRKEVIRKSVALTLGCLELENLVPTIRGTNLQEMASFVDYFKAQGKNLFVFTGREFLINLADRKRAQQEVFLLTATLARSEGIRLILTGCSSPKLQERLFAVWGFAGQGWLIQSMQRRLIKGKTYLSIFDKRFCCDDPSCCGLITINDLKNAEYDSVRAIHNLRRITASLNGSPRFPQTCLEEF